VNPVANISVANAKLPAVYESARNALASCERIDECKDWADKAEALASYARQADDESLLKLATRIKARAVRRCGELLKQFDGRGRPEKNNDGNVTDFSKAKAATQAGMSERQKVTAVRVANVPQEQFESALESEQPPTVTKLADLGKASRPTARPAGFHQATHVIGTLNRFAEFCQANTPEQVAAGVLPPEAKELRQRVSVIDSWLDRFVINLGSQS